MSVDKRRKIDELIVARGFGSYEEISEIVSDKDERLSSSALQRYGSQFKKTCDLLRAVTQQSELAGFAGGDDESEKINDLLIKTTQSLTFQSAMELQSTGADLNIDSIAKLTKNVSSLVESSIKLRRWKEQVKKQIEGRIDGLQKESPRLDEATLKRVREEIYGLF